MKRYTVTLPADFAWQKRGILGLGEFLAGVARTLELSDGQVASLRAKGFKVKPVKAEPEPVILEDSYGLS